MTYGTQSFNAGFTRALHYNNFSSYIKETSVTIKQKTLVKEYNFLNSYKPKFVQQWEL